MDEVSANRLRFYKKYGFFEKSPDRFFDQGFI